MENVTGLKIESILKKCHIELEWDERVKFRIAGELYFSLCAFAFLLTFEGNLLHGLHLKPGIIIGALFPTITILYFYRHYLGNTLAKDRTLSRWLLPSLFIQLIVIFGFIISLNVSKTFGYRTSMYVGFYQYGKIFLSYNDKEESIMKESAEEKFNVEEIKTFKKDVVEMYLPYFDKRESRIPGQTYYDLIKSLHSIPFLIAFTFGFLGALIFCLRDMIQRFNNVDLYPKNFIFFIVRFIVSCSLTVTLAYFVMGKWAVTLGPIVFFLIGYFPERVIKYLDTKMTEYLGIRKEKYAPIPLSLVQGLTAEKAMKLREIGIEDVQNLAVADIEKMRRNLPFSRAMLCDWIAQCILILYFPDEIEKLRKSGIRTIIDLSECMLGSDEQKCRKYAKAIEINHLKIQYIKKVINLNYMQTRLKELAGCLLSEYEKRYQKLEQEHG